MMKKTGIVTMAALAIATGTSFAASPVSLPWSTTFNCSDWVESSATWYNLNCDNLVGAGFDFCSDAGGSKPTEITANANNPNGGGGKGLRTLNGNGKDNMSGSLKVNFASPQNELWMKWAMRYQAGFAWNPLSYDKWLYIDVGSSCAVVPEWYGGDYVNVWTSCGGNYMSAAGNGWNAIMGGAVSDGKFHNFLVHLKMDTNGSNGIIEMWVDGVKRINVNNAKFGTKSGWGWFNISSNQAWVSNNSCYAVDFDDFYVSATRETLVPSAPTSLQAK